MLGSVLKPLTRSGKLDSVPPIGVGNAKGGFYAGTQLFGWRMMK